MANSRSLSPLRFLCYHCIRVHRCLASFHKHPCPLLHSSLLVQQECPSSMCDQWHSVVGHVGAYECTIVMLKRTALRRMVISLLETGQHNMTVFTISLWTRNPAPCSCCPLFHWRKPCVLPLLLFRQSFSISFHKVQGWSICTCPFRVLVPEVTMMYHKKWGSKRINGLENIVEIVIFWSNEPLLWPWHWK